MSSRELEEKMELEAEEQLASALGLSIEELDELDYEIHTNESNDGLIYEYVVHISESSPSEILSKIDGLSSQNYVRLQPYELESDPYEDELIWDILSSEQFENFSKSIKGAQALIRVVFRILCHFSKLKQRRNDPCPKPSKPLILKPLYKPCERGRISMASTAS